LKTREKIVDTMVGLTNEACDTLAPMCRPMWWLDATDKETFRIADQFAVGDDVIVAPVVTKGANKRDVYLTKGSWVDVDHADGEVFTGGRWLRNYPAPLAKLPCFVRVET
jgi:alpha-glucosidase (family GH31 glycosyl hydrolase)